jgi:protein-tyrosine phosphatase
MDAEFDGESADGRGPSQPERRVVNMSQVGVSEKTDLDGSKLREMIKLDGALNTRDFGGYRTGDGRTIKRGRLYRSSELSYLSDRDVKVIADLGITTVVDFRGLKEAHDAPDRLPDNVQVVPSPIIRDELNMERVKLFLERNNFPPPMFDFEKVSAYGPYYRMLTLVNSYADPNYVKAVGGYRPMFQQLLIQNPDEALLMHCTGGRDRTGFAVFLLMSALGVSDEDALDDYLISNVLLQPDRDNPDSTAFRSFRFSNVYVQPPHNKLFKEMATSLGTTPEAIHDSIRLRREYPIALRQGIVNQYGSLGVYLDQIMGIGSKELDIIRDKYTV